MEENNLFNLRAFHESTTKELDVIKNRVRNLIGDNNWNEEGRYKEAILKNVIKRFLPKKYLVGTGFIVKGDWEKYKCSNQVDILIFDSSYPILFSEGDFYIVTPNSVKAVIEVKSNIENQDLSKIIKKMNSVGEFIGKNKIFNGIFSFEGYDTPNNNVMRRKVEDKIKHGFERVKPMFVNHISLNQNIFMKRWNSKFSVYRLKDLSFSYFISNLIYHVTDKPIENESKMWFPENKESRKLFDIELGAENGR